MAWDTAPGGFVDGAYSRRPFGNPTPWPFFELSSTSLLTHPTSLFPTLRWTAGAGEAGPALISGGFWDADPSAGAFPGDIDGVEMYVHVNGTQRYHQQIANSDTLGGLFLVKENIAPGSDVDFSFGRDGLGSANRPSDGDTTGFTATVTHFFEVTTAPSRFNVNNLAEKPAGASNLVLIVHGTNSSAQADWVIPLRNHIDDELDENWQVVAYDWDDASGDSIIDAPMARQNAVAIGNLLANQAISRNYDNIHLIAHSAGAWLIDSFADKLRASGTSAMIQATFLDAYTPLGLKGIIELGDTADWAEHFVDSRPTSGLISPVIEATNATLLNAYNVDVTNLAPFSFNPVQWHGWPHDWYDRTVAMPQPEDEGWGFPRSIGFGMMPDHAMYPRGERETLGGPPLIPPTPATVVTNPVDFAVDLSITSSTGIAVLAGDLLNLITSSPAWTTTIVPVSEAAEFITFDATFLSDPGAEGFLSVFWDGILLGLIDERYVLPGTNDYFFEFPDRYGPGLYSLSFRLDPFTEVASSVTIENAEIGFTTIPEPHTCIAFVLLASILTTRYRASRNRRLMGPKRVL